MISKKYKLSRIEIEKIKSNPKSYSCPLFTCQFTNSEKKHSQYAVVISKKIEPIAVKRNALRRIVYRELDKYKELENKNIQAILYFKSSIKTANSNQISSMLSEFLEKLR